MKFTDPLESYRFDQDLQWVYNPNESLLNCTVFDSYAQSARKLSIYVVPERLKPKALSRKLLDAARKEPVHRLPDAPEMPLLMETGKATVSQMLVDGRRLRALTHRERDLCVTVHEVSSDSADGPDLSDHLARIKSSINAINEDRAEYAPGTDPAVQSRLLRQIRSAALQQGLFPGTRQVLALTRQMSHLALTMKSAWWASQAETFARLQANFLWDGALGGDVREFRLLSQMRTDVYAGIAELGEIDPSLAERVNALDAAFIIAEVAKASVPDGPPSHEPELKAPLLELALSRYLVAARRSPQLLGLLFAPPAPHRAARPPSGLGPDELTLTARIANVAGRLADARSLPGSGSNGESVEADRLSIAALRLLKAYDPGQVIDTYPVAALLGDRLFMAAEHLSAADDPLSAEEGSQLRQEAAELGSHGAPAEAIRVGVQEARDFYAALDEGRPAEAGRIGTQILDPSWEDAGRYPVDEQIIRAQMALALGKKDEMAAAAHTALRMLRVTFGKPAAAPADPGEPAEPGGEGALQRADQLTSLSYLLGAMGRRSDAITILNQAASIAGRNAPVGELSLRVLEAGAAAVEADGDGPLAARLSTAAALIIDALRLEQAVGEDRIRQLDGVTETRVYQRAVAMNLDQGRPLEALSAADRARGRGLLDSVQGGGRVLHPGSSVTGSAWDDVPGDCALERLGAMVGAVVPERYRAAGAPVPLRPDQLADLARRPDTLLLLQPLEDELALLVVGGKDGIHVERVRTDLRELERRVAQVHDAMWVSTVTRGGHDQPVDPDVPPVDGLLRELYDALIAPVVGRLLPSQPLTIVPHRDLALIPWAALTSPVGRYLVEDYRISVVPSLAVLESLGGRGAAPPPLRAYVAADPLLEEELLASYDQLPWARSDAERLRRFLEPASAGGPSPVILVGGDATETSYRTRGVGASLVHFACHAQLARSAAESCLYLAADDAHDGRLTAAEVSSVPLDRALVFLAACDSGQGRLSADGVIGLGQAFLDAGAQAVVLTLCKVSDAVASRLSTHYYQQLLPAGEKPGKRTAGAALRLATLATIEDLRAGRVIESDGTVLPPQPELWAAFFLLGRESARIGGPEGDSR